MKAIEYKKGDLVRHPKKEDWGVGIVQEDCSEKLVSIVFENAGLKLLSLDYVKPIKISIENFTVNDLNKINSSARVYFDEPFVDIYNDIKSQFPQHLVIIENGCYFEVFEEDAEYFSNLYGWKIYERQEGVPMTGFPEDAKKVCHGFTTTTKI